MARLAILLLFAALSAFAQPGLLAQPGNCANNQFGFVLQSGDVTLAASASTTLTIQQPSNPSLKRTVRPCRAVAQCKANTFDVSQSQNGTDATTTLATPVSLNPQNPNVSARVLAYTASNVGAGTAIAITYSYGAGSAPQVFDLTPLAFPQNAPNINYSITITNTGSGSDTCRLSIQWTEN